MIRKTIMLASVVLLMSSCVTKKLYNDLQAQYEDCMLQSKQLQTEADAIKADLNQLETNSQLGKSQLEKVQKDFNELQVAYDQLQKKYNSLEKNSDAAIRAEIEQLNKLRSTLDKNSSRIRELEAKLSAQERYLQDPKDSLSKALNAFEGKGLTVEQKNGKVYVSMENKLLFESGSWSVSSEGRKAVNELGKVLAQNPDISILIEGHTDNDKVVGTLAGGVTNNWDLSTKRATAIVGILENVAGINKQNITAAGRSEYAPVATNQTIEGKAKNRRIEVILAPKLDEISKMLNEI